MPKPKLAFAIDDALSVENNLCALKRAVSALDPALGAVFAPSLTAWASGESVDTEAVWHALYAATSAENSGDIGK